MAQKPTYEELENKIQELEQLIADSTQKDVTLRGNEEKYKSFYNNIPVGIFRSTPQGKLISTNKALAHMMGYETSEALMKLSAMDFYEDPEMRKVLFECIHEKGSVENFEMLTKHRDGHNIWVSTSIKATFDHNGNILFLDGIGEDITIRKRAEEKLLNYRQMSEKQINSLPGMFYVFDEQRFVRWNNAWNKVTGYSDEELAGMYGTDFFEGQDKILVGELMLKAFQEGAAEAEVELVTKSGRRIPYYCSGRRRKLNGKNYLIGLGIDITKQKHAEKEKLQALEYAAKQDKYALVGQIAGKMAHDFNNVLAVIMGNTQLALRDIKDAKISKILELIFNQTIRGQNLTKNLVVFANDQEPKQEFFKLSEKIELVYNLLKKDLQGIEWVKVDKPGVPDLLADPGMIEHALVNLVQNSIHAISMVKQPRITIRTFHKDNNIYLEIEDNGCGIPEEALDRVYEPAFTMKGSKDMTNSYKPEIKGTGYGMANIKKYIELHNGNILIDSKVWEGTKIIISFPFVKNESTEKDVIEIQKKSFSSGKYILLVEDEFALSDVQYKILTQEPFNHKVDIAANGQMAIDLFNRNKYDFISLDYILPGRLTGMDVYHHVRKNNKTVPILFISGNIEFLESLKELKHGDANVGHISKPCQNMDYVDGINKLLEHV